MHWPMDREMMLHFVQEILFLSSTGEKEHEKIEVQDTYN